MAISARAESGLAAHTSVRQSRTDFELDTVGDLSRSACKDFHPVLRSGSDQSMAPDRTILRGRDLPRNDEASLWKDCLYWFFCSLTASSGSSSAFCQLELGLYSFIALATTAVFLPRSF
jgi:hypothetical protein